MHRPHTLNQQTILLTGASSGIGYALALELAQRGATVIACGRNLTQLARLSSLNPKILTLPLDLQQTEALAENVQALLNRHVITSIIHNAAIQHAVRLDNSDYSSHQLHEEIQTNLLAPLELTRAILPHFISLATKVCRPQFIFIGSGLAFMPKPESATYCASKAALHSFVQSLRLQLRQTKIVVTEFILPLVDTPMTRGRGKDKLSPDYVAERIADSLNEASHRTIYLGKARFLPFLLRVAPWVVKRALTHS